MYKRLFLTPLVIIVLTASGTSCSSGTKKDSGVPLPNGGFETGELAPWVPFQSVQAVVDTMQVRSGKFSLAESGAKGSVYEDVKGLAAGVTYTVSAWVSASPDATATAQIAVFDAGNNVASFSDAMTPKPAWQLLKYDFKVSANSQGIARIHLFRNDGKGTIFWDDVQIERAQ